MISDESDLNNTTIKYNDKVISGQIYKVIYNTIDKLFTVTAKNLKNKWY